MYTNRPGCCLPKLLAYSVINAAVMAPIGASAGYLCDVSLKTSAVYSAVFGGLWPFLGKTSECCFDLDSTQAHQELTCRSITMLSSVYVVSSILSNEITQLVYDDFTTESAIKLSFTNFVGFSVLLGVSALCSICVVTVLLERQKTIIKRPLESMV